MHVRNAVGSRCLGAACATLALTALPAAAHASPQRAATLEAAFSPAVAGAATRVELHMTWADPGEPGGKPQPVRRLVLEFPAGTRIDTAALPRCAATNRRISAVGPSACPRATRLGSGRSVLTSGEQPLTASIVLINARRQIIVVVRVGSSTLAVYRDDVTRRTVTVNFALPPSLSLLDLRINIPVHVRGRRVYFRAPPSCPSSGSWPMTATSSYADGSTQQARARASCRARRARAALAVLRAPTLG